jgi:hypothetical protein
LIDHSLSLRSLTSDFLAPTSDFLAPTSDFLAPVASKSEFLASLAFYSEFLTPLVWKSEFLRFFPPLGLGDLTVDFLFIMVLFNFMLTSISLSSSFNSKKIINASMVLAEMIDTSTELRTYFSSILRLLIFICSFNCLSRSSSSFLVMFFFLSEFGLAWLIVLAEANG